MADKLFHIVFNTLVSNFYESMKDGISLEEAKGRVDAALDEYKNDPDYYNVVNEVVKKIQSIYENEKQTEELIKSLSREELFSVLSYEFKKCLSCTNESENSDLWWMALKIKTYQCNPYYYEVVMMLLKSLIERAEIYENIDV